MAWSDADWLAEAARLGHAQRGRTAPNPNVGCVIVSPAGDVIAGAATAPGGRPHAEAVALAAAGDRATGATLYTTLEPCAHASDRGPTCAALIPAAGIRRVVVAMLDPDPRTAGQGNAMLRAAGIVTDLVDSADARDSLSGYLTRLALGRPRITLKLALSIDGKIALPSGESKWITGEDARAHVHLERAHSDMILVGRGTWLADSPSLDVRLPGLDLPAPRRALLTSGAIDSRAIDGWEILASPSDVFRLHDVNDLLVEGGSGAATAFLAADLVDRILIYRAPLLIGAGKSSVGYIGLDALADAHGRWHAVDGARLGIDRLEVYERVPPSGASLDYARDERP